MPSSGRDRTLYWVPAIFAVGAAIALYGPVVAGLVRQWYDDPSTAYGAWLVAAAAFVVKRRWKMLKSTAVRPYDPGFLLLGLALAVYAVAVLAGDLFLLRLSMPLCVAACVLCLLGLTHGRLLFAPIGLLLLAIPLPKTVVAHVTLPLQLFASQLAASTLDVLGIPVSRAGNLLALPDITLEIAQACSGLQSVVSLVSVAAICAAVVPLTLRRGLFLIVLAVPVAIVGNGLRIATTAVLATWIGERAVHGAIHEATGNIAFLLMCAAILGLLVATRPQRRDESLVVASASLGGER